MESLLNGSASTAAANDAVCQATATTGAQWVSYCKLMAPAFFTPVVLNASHVASLSGVGITEVSDNNPDTQDATFKSVLTTPRTLAALGNLAGVSPTPSMGVTTTGQHLVNAFGGQLKDYDNADGTVDGTDACYDYIAFGFGDGNSMVGRSMQSAPIHFAGNQDMGPTNKYNRFVVVYKVDKSNTAPCSSSNDSARLIGSSMAMGAMSGGLWGVGTSAAHAYSNMAAANK
jgi:hypothetical protein